MGFFYSVVRQAMNARCGGKHNLSFEDYHAIPERWTPAVVLAIHKTLGGNFDIATRPRVAVGGRGRSDYRALWYNIADGVRAGDQACVELAIQFIEEHLIVSYSGFARSRIARALRHCSLSQSQKGRLSAQFLTLLATGNRCEEFSEYLKLWPLVVNSSDRKRAIAIVSMQPIASPQFRDKVMTIIGQT